MNYPGTTKNVSKNFTFPEQKTNAPSSFAKTGILVDNWTGFSQNYNDLGLNPDLESYSYKQELLRMA